MSNTSGGNKMKQVCPVDQLWSLQENFNLVDCWWFFTGYLCRRVFMSDMELDVPLCRQQIIVYLLNNWYGVLKIWVFASLIWRMIRIDQKLQAQPGMCTQILKTSLCGQSLLCLHTCMSVYPDILQKSWRADISRCKLRGLFRKIRKQTFTKQQEGNFHSYDIDEILGTHSKWKGATAFASSGFSANSSSDAINNWRVGF